MQSTFIERRYVPMYEAGFGGTANIFAAFDTQRRELVAIKCISREAYPTLKKVCGRWSIRMSCVFWTVFGMKGSSAW